MTHPELHGNLALGGRQYAPRRRDPIVGDHHRPVVQRRILEKDIFDQRGGNQRIDTLSLLDKRQQVHFTGNHDQRAGLGLRHIGAGSDHRIDPFLPDDLHFPSARTEQPGHKRHPPIRILRAEQDQKTPDLLLEHDNQRDYPHADDLPEYHTEQFHIQHAGHDPQQVDNQDADNDAQRIRPPCQPIHLKHNQRHHEDIDNIDQRNIQKSEAHSRNKGNKRMTKRQLFSQPPFYHAPKDLRTLTSQQALCGESGRMRSGSR